MLGSGGRDPGAGEPAAALSPGTDVLTEGGALTPEMLPVPFLLATCSVLSFPPRYLREKTCSVSLLQKKKLPFNWAGRVTGSPPLALQCLREIK